MISPCIINIFYNNIAIIVKNVYDIATYILTIVDTLPSINASVTLEIYLVVFPLGYLVSDTSRYVIDCE